MRLEYGFQLAECDVPRFAVEAVEARVLAVFGSEQLRA